MRSHFAFAPLALLGVGLLGAGLSGEAKAQTGAAAGTGGSVVENDFRIQAVPAYEGGMRMGDAIPLLVRIENLGRDTGGVVVVTPMNESGQIRYPVALPRGSKKTVPISVTSTGGDVPIVLQTDRGSVEVRFSPRMTDARSSVLVIGDGSGGFSFVDKIQAPKSSAANPPGSYEQNRQFVTVAYGKPESVPDGEAGFDRLSCIALSAGSERLNARQIAALHRYTMRGGHLVLFGGASAPVLTDPRWRDLLPYSALEPAEVGVGNRSVSIQRPVPLPGLRRVDASGVPFVRRDYGLGRVTFLSADPTEGGLESSPLRTRIVAEALDLTRSSQYARLPMERGPEIVAGGVGVSTGDPSDPFSLAIPPTTSILFVLGGYFLIVLPVNFLLLRAFKRLELAWFTAPLIAIGFAGLLFRNAGSLYNTQLSHATQASLLTASGAREGLALGKAHLFFPAATRGPIPLPGAEAIGASLFYDGNMYGYMARSEGLRSLDVLVTDGPSIPEYASTALEFRDFDFRQSIDLGRGIRVIGPRSWQPGSEREVRVVNGSPYTLKEIRVAQGPASDFRLLGSDAPLGPGESVTLRKPVQSGIDAGSGLLYRSAPMLIASLQQHPAGPQMGKTVEGRTWTRIVVSGEME